MSVCARLRASCAHSPWTSVIAAGMHNQAPNRFPHMPIAFATIRHIQHDETTRRRRRLNFISSEVGGGGRSLNTCTNNYNNNNLIRRLFSTTVNQTSSICSQSVIRHTLNNNTYPPLFPRMASLFKRQQTRFSSSSSSSSLPPSPSPSSSQQEQTTSQPSSQQQQQQQQLSPHLSPTSQTTNDKYLTVPNAMTVLRMALAPYVAYLIVAHQDFEQAFWVAFVAGLLDGLDGWVARTWTSQASVIGSYIDPLADKLLVTCAALGLAYQDVLNPWLVGLIVGRDLFLVVGGLVLHAKQLPKDASFFSTKGALQVQPTTLSKINTALQLALVCAGLTSAAWGVPAAAAATMSFDDILHLFSMPNSGGGGGGVLEPSSAIPVQKNTSAILSGLVLPTLSISVATTTFLSGLGYWFDHGYKKPKAGR